MITITKRPFTYEKDFLKLYDFLSKNYDCGTYHNWDVARLMFTRYGVYNRFHSKNIHDWEKHVQVWENENNEIVGCVHTEEPMDYFMQVAKDYKYLEEDMLGWILDEWNSQNMGETPFIISTGIHDEKRQELFDQFHGIQRKATDKKRSIILDHLYPLPFIGRSYRLAKMSPNDLAICQRVALCYNEIWPESRYLPNKTALADLLRSPACDNSLTWVVLNSDHEAVAYTIGFKDTLNECVHLYPVAIREEYLDTHILEYLLKTALNTCYLKGFTTVAINGKYKPREEAVFKSLGFITEDQELLFNFTN